MAKIPFTLDAWLKDKSQKVETREGRIVHDIWHVKSMPIKGSQTEVCALIDGEEDALVFFTGGRYLPVNADSPYDLFIITPEPELTEFEHAFGIAMMEDPELEDEWYLFLKEKSSELLSLAKKELCSYHDESNPMIEAMADLERAVSCGGEIPAWLKDEFKKQREDGKADVLKNIPNDEDMKAMLQLEYDKGRADTLKDLPRWEKCNALNTGQTAVVIGYTKDEDKLYRCGKSIKLCDLEKLPGFKEN